jgi:undecaprenyl-diphosphatase
VKPLVERSRPCAEQSSIDVIAKVRCGSGYSFTSSHATNHFAIAIFFIFTLGRYIKYLSIGLIVWASLISLAQVYVGVHYPSDIFCGMLLGIAIGYFWSKVFNRYYGLGEIA